MTFTQLATKSTIQRAAEAIRARGINVELVETKEEALQKVRELIPTGGAVMTGASTTLDQIGFTELLVSGDHPWTNLKDAIVAEQDPARQMQLRKESVLADYFLGSVHAIAETGELLIGSASASQFPSYAYSSKNVIWVAGTHKIVPTLADGFRRLRQYVVPLEDERMKGIGAPGTMLAKTLIIEHEPPFMQRTVTLILVEEELGF